MRVVVHGQEKLDIVGETLPTTVKAEQEVPPEQEADDVATLATAAPFAPPYTSWFAVKDATPVPPEDTASALLRLRVPTVVEPVTAKVDDVADRKSKSTRWDVLDAVKPLVSWSSVVVAEVLRAYWVCWVKGKAKLV